MKKLLLIASLMLASCVVSATEAVKVTFELSKNGQVVNSASIPTLDGEGQDYRSGDEIIYLKDAKGAGETRMLTPGKVETGLTMSVIPTITLEGMVQMSVTGKQVDIISLDTKKLSKSGETVRVPNVDEHKLDYLFTAKSGEEQTFTWTSRKTHNSYVLTITPTIIDNPHLASR